MGLLRAAYAPPSTISSSEQELLQRLESSDLPPVLAMDLDAALVSEARPDRESDDLTGLLSRTPYLQLTSGKVGNAPEPKAEDVVNEDEVDLLVDIWRSWRTRRREVCGPDPMPPDSGASNVEPSLAAAAEPESY